MYNTNVMIDWKTGDLYSFDPDTFTDNTFPIVCIRGFPHLGANGNEVSYPGFMADMDVGRSAEYAARSDLDVTTIGVFIGVSVRPSARSSSRAPRWSRCGFPTRAERAFGNKRQRSLGTTGEYGKILSVGQLGLARDGVFELEWAVPCKTALNGAFLWPEPEQAET
jgi:hypothetical protein